MPEQQQPRPPFPSTPVAQEVSAAGPKLVSRSALPPTPPPPDPGFREAEIPPRIPYWLQQAERFMRVIVRIYIGLLVCLVPWYAPFWDSNPLFTQFPWLIPIVTQGAVRGLISGLGLLNFWVALQDMIRMPDNPRSR